ncbi:MAG TPA: aldo/keto reductase [Actinomycetota bacterium]|nr:aldo/keto reductase [Actinomycetota bacterium]
MIRRTVEVGGTTVPTFLYGTAWKEDRTYECVLRALEAGFRGIDTANQRRHYHEAEVGRAVQDALSGGALQRTDLFLQTKYTFLPSQDRRLPYDPTAPIARQVEQSFSSSLDHLGVETVDSYVLHGPTMRDGLSAADLEAWGAMEALHARGAVRLLGVSNFTPRQLQMLLSRTKAPLSFVQNRCYAALGWDAAVRAICDREGVVYQGFSLLTANVDVLRGRVVQEIALRHGRLPGQVVFRFALQIGMIPLTGTTDPAHMKEDLAVYDFELSDAEVAVIEQAGVR